MESWAGPGNEAINHRRARNLHCLWAACHWWSVVVQMRSKFSSMLQFQLSPLWVDDATGYRVYKLDLRKIFQCAHLHLRYMAASKRTYTHTHAMQSRFCWARSANYLQDELKAGSCRASTKAFPDIRPPVHVSSFRVIPKKHRENVWRLIVDLLPPDTLNVKDSILGTTVLSGVYQMW